MGEGTVNWRMATVLGVSKQDEVILFDCIYQFTPFFGMIST